MFSLKGLFILALLENSSETVVGAPATTAPSPSDCNASHEEILNFIDEKIGIHNCFPRVYRYKRGEESPGLECYIDFKLPPTDELQDRSFKAEIYYQYVQDDPSKEITPIYFAVNVDDLVETPSKHVSEVLHFSKGKYYTGGYEMAPYTNLENIFDDGKCLEDLSLMNEIQENNPFSDCTTDLDGQSGRLFHFQLLADIETHEDKLEWILINQRDLSGWKGTIEYADIEYLHSEGHYTYFHYSICLPANEPWTLLLAATGNDETKGSYRGFPYGEDILSGDNFADSPQHTFGLTPSDQEDDGEEIGLNDLIPIEPSWKLATWISSAEYPTLNLADKSFSVGEVLRG